MTEYTGCVRCKQGEPWADVLLVPAANGAPQLFCPACIEIRIAEQARRKAVAQALAKPRHKRVWPSADRDAAAEGRAIRHDEFNWPNQGIHRKIREREAAFGEIDYQEIIQRDCDICWICGEAVDPTRRGFDHAVALSRGGEHSTRNIRVVHRECNTRKATRHIPHQKFLL